jgi:hypothetical protein
MPLKKRPQAFTPDSPLPAAAATKKLRTSPAKTPRKNKALKEAELGQETHVSVNAFRALEYIGCEDAVPILRDSIDIDDYNQRLSTSGPTSLPLDAILNRRNAMRNSRKLSPTLQRIMNNEASYWIYLRTCICHFRSSLLERFVSMVGCGLIHTPARSFLQLISMLGKLIALQNHGKHLTQFS